MKDKFASKHVKINPEIFLLKHNILFAVRHIQPNINATIGQQRHKLKGHSHNTQSKEITAINHVIQPP